MEVSKVLECNRSHIEKEWDSTGNCIKGLSLRGHHRRKSIVKDEIA